MAFADTLTERERRRARLLAYGSSLTGCISDIMLDSSAIIILYFTMLRASSMLTMLTTGLPGFLSLFLMIPFAGLTDKLGQKRSIKIACITGCIGYLIMASAAFLPDGAALPAAFIGCAIHSAQRGLFAAAWYPLIDNFLRKEDRGKFFSVMRTAYMLFSGVLFFIIGLLMGKDPPMWFMQGVIAFAGLALLLRWVCLSFCPTDPDRKNGTYDLKKALRLSLTNAPLTGYSIYLCLLAFFSKPLLPLVLLYLKRYVDMAPGTVQILSSIGIGGAIAGYSLYGLFTGRIQLKYLELGNHLIFIVLAFLFFFVDKSTPGFTWIIGSAIFLLSVCNAFFLCNSSMEFLALARPGNKTMAIAFCQTYQNAGVMMGNTATSLILGSSIFAATWTTQGGTTYSVYQSIFLILGIIGVMALILIPIMPSFIPRHEDYYEPEQKNR